MRFRSARKVCPTSCWILAGCAALVCASMSTTLAREAKPVARSVVTASHGMVATSQPLAVQAGLDVLKAGGNAADAAIAADAMLGLVEPMSCGIGGDLFVMYWDAKTSKLYGLNASGRSPYTINRDVFKQKGLEKIPLNGPLSWTVPGCVSGWDELNRRFGTRKLGDLLEPAVQRAEEGFSVTPVIAQSWQTTEPDLMAWPDSVTTFLPGGHAPHAGKSFRNPNLAASYRLLAKDGPDAFYRGPIAEKVVAFSRLNGGYFELQDFGDHRSDWVEPVSTTYRGYRVWELPPNGQGITVLEMLNVLEPFNLRALGPCSPQYLHLLVEAKKLAFADRARFYADPAFSPAPIEALISKSYADSRRRLINLNRAALDFPVGDPKLAASDRHGDTIYLTVVDKDRNCCSFIQSNFEPFGSKVVPGDVGFCLQNRGNLFALADDHLNGLEPHKRPFHTIIPGFVTKDGKPWLCFGVMGGDMQPQGQVQVLVNLIDFGMNLQQAGDSPRVRHDGSPTPTGLPVEPRGGTIFAEAGIPDQTLTALRAKGHQVARDKPTVFGGYQAILIDWKTGQLQGASDTRKDGCALGY
jgi:gamma-glutamyltranspeptidase / glutathione hydrolase